MPILLRRIKLAGFKSFVDPTSILLPSHLIGVVGPNGCGKSNVIDAVRWVMGESSAKMLRGESMSDVIFNGSTARKPVGQAFVELVFDNSDGSLGGEYAQYSEISIKRLVSRDGTSNYYLNGARCRRKDITDIFLGTGLGPRSYAIIEQGMISRIIEAKPEELRVYIEEAAGISKYKERRKETESRIQHTRENLDRLNDIREELTKQLDRLQRQAQDAERYKNLRAEQRELQAQLFALRWKITDQSLQAVELLIKEQQTQYESHIAGLRQVETQIVEHREKQSDFRDQFNESQENYYRIGSEIARLEEAIQFQQQRKVQLREEQQQVRSDLSSVEEQHTQDVTTLENLEQELLEILPVVELQKRELENETQLLNTQEQQQQAWQNEWDDFNRNAAQSSEKAHVQQTRIQYIENQIEQIKQRVSRLQLEGSELNPDPVIKELELLTNEHQLLTEKFEEYQQKREENRISINELRETINKENRLLETERTELQRLQGRHASLDALQQAAFGKQTKNVASWLEQQGLSKNLRLAQLINVEDGWEKAVEVLLADHLQAICLEDFSAIIDELSALDKCSIGFVSTGHRVAVQNGEQGRHSLAEKVTSSSEAIQSLLANVFTAETLTEGLERVKTLLPHETIVTKDGICLGHGWLQIKNDDDPSSGVIQREQEIKQITKEIESLADQIKHREEALTSFKQNLNEMEQTYQTLQKQISETHSELSDRAAKQQIKRARVEQLTQRKNALEQESSEFLQQISELNEELLIARDHWQSAMKLMEDDAIKRQHFTSQKEQLSETLQNLKNKVVDKREVLHQKQLLLQAQQSQRESLRQNIQRLNERMKQLQQRLQQLIHMIEIEEMPDAEVKTQLENKLKSHLEAESEFKQARHRLEEIEERLNELEDQKHDIEQDAQQSQQQISQKQVDAQTYRVQCVNFIEQLGQTGFELNPLLETLPADAEVAKWEERITSIETRINRLGAINLAAIDEFKTESERKNYLDAQHDDLVKALDTLEQAIRKIDAETKAKFKETYDVINEHFKTLFPRLFGGGHAHLTLLDDDLLNTGITVIAKPPGKQNSRIQMLSGGEKAMTAVALVFAIFQLNPSPFCMLDEVDAPLDEANVGRYCNLVREMSEKIQFIFITHNKVTMELADHLMGVTMHEPGVSRLVSVNVAEAVSLAEA